MLNSASSHRNYNVHPLIAKDYSYFFGVSLRFFSIFVGTTIMIDILFFIMKEEIEIWFLFVPAIVPLALVLYDYYAYVARDSYTLYFANNSINDTLDGKLKRKINIDKIPNYLLKPFWKNKFDIQTTIIILVIIVFIYTCLFINLSKLIS